MAPAVILLDCNLCRFIPSVAGSFWPLMPRIFMKIWIAAGPLPLPIMLVKCWRVLTGCTKWHRRDHIIPGHDPLVMRLYPAVDGFDGKVVQLDVRQPRCASTANTP